MAYDEELAARIRQLLAAEPDVTEKRMFGGLAFLVGGHMAVAVSGQGGLMIRVAPEETEALLSVPGTGPMIMRGRALDGWLRVTADTLASDEALRTWTDRGRTYVRTLPPKS